MTADNSPGSDAGLGDLARLWEEHRARLTAVVRQRLAAPLAVRIDPDDVLSEAFLEACRRLARDPRPAGWTSFAWLYGVVRDRLIECWRHAARGRRDLRRDLPWPEHSSVQLGLRLVSPETTPASAAARQELQRQMREALDLLGEADREVLWMRYFDGLTFPEIGVVLGILENTAAVRCARALCRLRELWQRLGGTCP